jgi:peptidoglycan/LPS O-acetylase OafA/YrhL
VHDAYYARAIGRIRSFYFDIAGGDARRYWLLTAGDDQHAVMRHAGQRHTRWHHWTHQATAVAAVTAVIAGVLGGLALHYATPARLPATAVVGVVLAVLVLVALLTDQERRWRRCEELSPALFAPDGTPTGAQLIGGAAAPGCHL